MKNKPLVSVCITAYQLEKYIGHCIRSVLGQDYQDLEVFVFDNASSDSTQEVVEQYLDDPRITYVRNSENIGLIPNNNMALSKASGKYVSWLHGDDFLLPGHFSLAVDVLEKNPHCALSYGLYYWVDECGRYIRLFRHPGHVWGGYLGGRNEYSDLLINDCYIAASSALIRKSCLDEVGLLDEEIHACDWDLYVRIAAKFGDFAYINRATSAYRIHSDQDSSKFYDSDSPLASHIKILEKNLVGGDAVSLGLWGNHIASFLKRRASMYSPEVQIKYKDRIDAVIRNLSEIRDCQLSEKLDNPKISVVVPTMNRPEFLQDALGSLNLQGYENWEAVIVNDAGEDVSGLVESFNKRGNLKYISHSKNRGLSAARNTALNFCSGDIVCYLDDDDIFYENHLNSVAECFRGSSIKFVYTDANCVQEEVSSGSRVIIRNDGRYVGNEYNIHRLHCANYIPVNSWAHKRSLLDEVGRFDEELSSHEDWDFLLRVSRKTDFCHLSVTSVEVRERDDPQRISHKMRSSLREVFNQIYSRYDDLGSAAVRNERSKILSSFGGGAPEQVVSGEDGVGNTPSHQQEGVGTWEGGLVSYLGGTLDSFSDGCYGNDWVPTFAVVYFENKSVSEASAGSGLNSQWVSCEVLTVGEDGGDPPSFLHAANAGVMDSTADWICFVDAGCVLPDHALFLASIFIHANPDWQIIYTDEDSLDSGGGRNAHYKPDFNLDYFRSMPYVGGLLFVRRSLFEVLGGFDQDYIGAEEYEFVLRAWEYLESVGPGAARAIGHIPWILYHRKPGANRNNVPLDASLQAMRSALKSHLERLGCTADVEPGLLPATHRVNYRHSETPLVSIIIPTRNQRGMLERCLESLLGNTNWPNYEILIVDNGSDEVDAVQYLRGLQSLGADMGGRIRIVDYPHSFNYSAMNNLAAEEARGEYLLLLNNDTAALHSDWLDVMMAHVQRDEVGVVGAKLLYPDGNVQHAGVVLGINGPAEHPFIGHEAKEPGYFGRLQVDQNYSAVTGACLLVNKALFDEVGGLDADELAVSYSDIDLCLKVRERGKLVVWTPHALLLHEGSKSQKAGVESADDQAKLERFHREQAVMYRRWMPLIANDPSYNRHLSLRSTDFIAETDPALFWGDEWKPAPRVIAQPADRMGCGEYRIIAPARALINAGHVQGHEIDRIYTPPELAKIKPDALVLQRQVEPHQIDAIERHKRFNDVFCVFEIDDLVTNVPVKNAHKKHLPKDLYKRLRRAVGVCDRLVVATDALAEAYSGLNSDVKVIPNFIEDARWGRLQTERRVGRKPRVGWAGGVSHTGDLDLIAGVVEALKDEVEWVFFGMCPERVRPYVHEFHEPVSIDQYASRLAGLNLDLAVAPLEDVPFNHAKSHLRLLEYGILGYPVVCSDLTPYRGDYPVTRVRNRHRDWVEAIRAHVSDLDATSNQGDALRKYVREHWLLENNLDTWLEGWLP